ncbi:MAG: tyrosine recombinase [Candidatus Babeliales bacterium]
MHLIVVSFEAYLLTQKRVSANTFAAYKQDLAQYLTFLNRKKIALEKATVQEIKSFLKVLKQEKLSARSMARKISSLKMFYQYAHQKEGWPDSAQELISPRITKTLPKFLTEQEVKDLLQVAGSDASQLGERNRLLLHLLYASGMRISELIAIRLGQLHQDTGFVAIEGKGSKQRLVPLPLGTWELIRAYLASAHKQFCDKYNNGVVVEYLFPILYADTIKHITRQACWGIVKKMCEAAGIKRAISPHQLRHSLATHLLKKGADLRSLQLWLGHENVNTVQIYTHVETDFLRQMYDKKHPRS